MLTLASHFTGNAIGLSNLLINLQPQLAPEDDIYIVDSTPKRLGLEIAKRYRTTRSLVFVEVGDYSHDQALLYAYQNMKRNQKGLLYMDDTVIASQTFISNLKRASKYDYDVLAPVVSESPYSVMDSNFAWYNLPVTQLTESILVPEKCYYVKKDAWDKDDRSVAFFINETVCVLPPLKLPLS